MERISTVVERNKQKLKVQLREAEHVDLHVHVGAGNLEKLKFRCFGKTSKSNLLGKHWKPIS